jgi:NADPH-dependent 2,4-dienoyl-CoA reductase/sulfur reductase-like enzyme
MTERLVVVGGDAAGMTAASQARRRRGGNELEIVAFEKGNFVSYSACGIPYWIGGTVDDLETLIARPPEVFRDRHDIDVRLRHEVTGIDIAAGKVAVRDHDSGTEKAESFDQLVIATGAVPVKPDLPGDDAAGIFGVQTLDDGVAVYRDLEAAEPRRAVVIGGGYIGLEMAEALVRRGLHVSLVEANPQPMGTLDPDMGALVTDALRKADVEVFTGEAATGFESRGGRVTALITSQRTIEADIAVMGLGVRPNVALARDAGLAIGESGGIRVDRRMATSEPGVWAGGDCAEKFHRVAHRPVAIALGTHANKEGRTIGINIGGGYATFPGVIGTAVSKICDVEVARSGLTEKEAAEAGFAPLTATVDSTTRASYFPGTAPIKTKLIVEKRSGRLLGGQIVGREGAAKRIDTVAAAIWSGMTADEAINLDLSYAPPFSPLWDPVLIAARKAWQLVEETQASCT